MAVPQLSSQPPGHQPGVVVVQPRSVTIGERASEIEGGFRRITAHQLVMAWWLHIEGHLTRRQLRVYFAAHEMAERRHAAPRHRAGRQESSRKPLYRLREVKSLVGGRGSPTATAELQGDVKALGRLGLVRMTAHGISFAQSIEQIRLDDVSGFWTMFQHIPNGRRTVPVPRRMLRALAAGFGRAETGVILALLIRSVFWHREKRGGQAYRVDGRTKGSWIAEVFQISRRGVSDARTHLTEIGWLQPIDAPQWQLNRWGAHDRINIEWSPRDQAANGPGAVGGEGTAENPSVAGESASPPLAFSAESASPCLNRSSPQEGKNTNTSNPRQKAPDPAGVSTATDLGSRKKETGREGDAERSAPTIRNIQAADLGDTHRLIELHRQAGEIGLTKVSEAGRLAFMALAERARTRGKKPGALFAWLLREKKYAFITQADEDAAAQRLREIHNGRRRERQEWGGGGGWIELGSKRDNEASGSQQATEPETLSDDDRFVVACRQVAVQHRIDDPFRVARMAKDWSRDQWDAAVAAYAVRQLNLVRRTLATDLEE